jgi:hypothetical protein
MILRDTRHVISFTKKDHFGLMGSDLQSLLDKRFYARPNTCTNYLRIQQEYNKILREWAEQRRGEKILSDD